MLAETVLPDIPDINVMVFSLGTDYCISDLNSEVETRTGLTRDTLLGCHIEEFQHADQNRIEVGKPLLLRINNFEFTLLHKDGTLILLEASAIREVDSGGKHHTLTIVAYDITARATLLKEHNAVVREHEHTKSELQNFAHLAAEDLGEPLQQIASLFDVLRDDLCGTSELEINMFEQAKSHALFMHEKLKGLMELSLIDVSQEAYRIIDLMKVVNQVLEKHSEKLSVQQLEIIFDSLEDSICIFSSDLSKIFDELFDNSIKYSNPEVPLQISIWSEVVDGGDSLELYLRDNGLGMPPLSQIDPRLPFVRLHRNSGNNGLGIGLTRCSRLVRKFSGELSIDSELGKGTTVKIKLKRMRVRERNNISDVGADQRLRRLNLQDRSL